MMQISQLLVIISSLVGATLAHPAGDSSLLPRANAINFKGCSSTQQSLISADLADMETLAAAAAAAAVPYNKYFKAFFGQEPSRGVTDHYIKDRFQSISKARTQAWHENQAPTIRCDAENAPFKRCNNGFGAPAGTTGGGGEFPTIWLCQNYWKGRKRIKDIALPAPNSQHLLDLYVPTGGALLHEFTHAWYSTTDVKMNGLKPPDNVAYGQERALRLAQENGGAFRARNNADNYRMFAAAVTLRGAWSTNPDKLTSGRPDF